MKKTVLTFGLISGAVFVVVLAGVTPFVERIGFEWGTVIGYTSMVLAFLLVFFGVRSYRENVGGGHISFARAFTVGILITLVSCICYVVSWEIVYFNFLPDFFEKYSNYAIEQLRASGASADQIAKQADDMQKMKVLYDKPLFNAAFTFLEPFPVGLLITLISALILRRRPRPSPEDNQLSPEQLAGQNG